MAIFPFAPDEAIFFAAASAAPEEDPAEEKDWWDSFTSWFSCPDNDLRIELPRVLVMTDPVFSIRPLDADNTLTPEENYLTGTTIRLHFDYEPAYEEHLPLYIYSQVGTFCVDIIYKGASSEIASVEFLLEK